MFAVISKRDYWGALKDGVIEPKSSRLKDIQDAFILHQLKDISNARILELGGGNSRVLPILARDNECWNVDKFEGLGQGPTGVQSASGVRLVRDYLGGYSAELPSNYFDYIISVSAVEHVPAAYFPDMVKDSLRVLKTGGLMIHAIDVYLLDDISDHEFGEHQRSRIALYKSMPQISEGKFEWVGPLEIDESITASASFATNSVGELYSWNSIVPSLERVREIAMSCSLKLLLRKVD